MVRIDKHDHHDVNDHCSVKCHTIISHCAHTHSHSELSISDLIAQHNGVNISLQVSTTLAIRSPFYLHSSYVRSKLFITY